MHGDLEIPNSTRADIPVRRSQHSIVSIRPILDYLIHFPMPNFGSHSRAQEISSDLTDSDKESVQGKDLCALGVSIEVSASFFCPESVMNKYLRKVSGKHKQECRI